MKKTRKILKRVFEIIDQRKGEDIVIVDVSRISSFTDFFIICTGRNQRQNQAICDAVKEALKAESGLSPAHVEGYGEGEWILMDYLGFVIHIFSAQARDFYKLERLWNDGVQVEPQVLIA